MTKPNAPTPEALVDELLAVEEQKAMSRYINDGRVLSELSTEALQRLWVGALRTMIGDRTRASFRDLDDVNAEYSLRGSRPDEAEVAKEMAAIREEIMQAGPDDVGVRAAIGEFLDSRDRKDA